MNYKERAQNLYDMMDNNQMHEAFEKYYSENCTVCEKPTGEVRQGKEVQRKAIKEWEQMIKEVHGGGTTKVTSDEDNRVTMVESWMEITDQNDNRFKMEEVAVQQWNAEGQIEREDFYYHMPNQAQQ